MATCWLLLTLTIFVLLSSSDVFGQDTTVPDQQTFYSTLLGIPVDNLETITNSLIPDSTQVTTEDVKFFFCPPGSNDSILITAENASQVLDVTKNTTFIIHGWQGNADVTWVVVKAYLLNKYWSPINVIKVDWSSISDNLNYIQSAGATTAVGVMVGNFLLAIKLDFLRVHIIGHSLGAHVAGSAGQTTSGKLDRITGEDPAGPLYETPPMNRKLTRNDAIWVDVIHTGWPYGVGSPCGKNDFYVNSAIVQPNCQAIFVENPYRGVVCSHRDSHAVYSQTIIEPTLYLGFNRVTGQEAYMGHQVTRIEGLFNVTADNIPDPWTM